MGSAQVVGLDACSTSAVDRGRVEAAEPLLLGQEESVQIAGVFDLLSDASRVRVLFALLEVGEACVCDLAEMVHMSQSALSHALRLLRTAGVVTNRRDGRMVRYRLADSHVRLLLDVTREHLGHAPASGRP
ncbi:MAG TPA: metalloregulator ArsR/SmtB family transcription factor [Marmoricola sp.]|nr:metalloregulator ArsR/SmtB family transcription factor [Marmoricola sp.]